MPRIQEDKPIQQKEIPKGKLRENKKKPTTFLGRRRRRRSTDEKKPAEFKEMNG